MKVRVTITYTSSKMGHSRYGYVQRQETATRIVEEAELDGLVTQFRKNHEVIEIRITK